MPGSRAMHDQFADVLRQRSQRDRLSSAIARCPGRLGGALLGETRDDRRNVRERHLREKWLARQRDELGRMVEAFHLLAIVAAARQLKVHVRQRPGHHAEDPQPFARRRDLGVALCLVHQVERPCRPGAAGIHAVVEIERGKTVPLHQGVADAVDGAFLKSGLSLGMAAPGHRIVAARLGAEPRRIRNFRGLAIGAALVAPCNKAAVAIDHVNRIAGLDGCIGHGVYPYLRQSRSTNEPASRSASRSSVSIVSRKSRSLSRSRDPWLSNSHSAASW